MARDAVPAVPFLPGRFPDEKALVDLANSLRSHLTLVANAINDDLIVIPDWTRAISADYQMLSTDRFILADASGGAITITLPPVAETERHLYGIKRITSGAGVTIASFGSELMDGSSGNRSLSPQWDGLSMISDRVAWFLAGGFP